MELVLPRAAVSTSRLCTNWVDDYEYLRGATTLNELLGHQSSIAFCPESADECWLRPRTSRNLDTATKAATSRSLRSTTTTQPPLQPLATAWERVRLRAQGHPPHYASRTRGASHSSFCNLVLTGQAVWLLNLVLVLVSRHLETVIDFAASWLCHVQYSLSTLNHQRFQLRDVPQ
ncbi:hypothetical protein VTK26DRAFT_7852 [Humicola hyalothermophila]